MKDRILAMLLGALAPMLASAADLNIPAQPLGASLESLASQIGVQIVFDPSLVALLEAPALKGSLSTEQALDQLLARTDLTYHVKDTQTIEIAVPIDEVTVSGRYEKLSAMRKEYEQLEDRFYDEYNKLNTDPQWDVHCQQSASTGTHLRGRVCTPGFVDTIERDFAVASLQGHAGGGSPWVWIQAKKPAYQQNMTDLVKKNPKLLELLMKRNAAAQRYADVRKKKFEGGKLFVWD
jgi:Secretin and TonB N terminus short domain